LLNTFKNKNWNFVFISKSVFTAVVLVLHCRWVLDWKKWKEMLAGKSNSDRLRIKISCCSTYFLLQQRRYDNVCQLQLDSVISFQSSIHCNQYIIPQPAWKESFFSYENVDLFLSKMLPLFSACTSQMLASRWCWAQSNRFLGLIWQTDNCCLEANSIHCMPVAILLLCWNLLSFVQCQYWSEMLKRLMHWKQQLNTFYVICFGYSSLRFKFLPHTR